MSSKSKPTNKPYMDDVEEEIKTNKPRRRVNNRKVYDDDDLDEYESDRTINEMDAYKNISKNRGGRSRKQKE